MQREITNEDIYNKLLELEKVIKGKYGKKAFEDVAEWKQFIWDQCPHRKEKATREEIDFWCDILNAPCEFQDCPRNVL
ncbi:hypothetical protein JW930_03400 [Candidatus Woesearchaeota archaeon]|nr:hypothetical protein [Candidatus Woesearchaeota archaeon]